jgi:hypothetical protein
MVENPLSMHGKVFSCAVAALRVYVGITRNIDSSTANKFPNRFSNFVQAEHDNIIETCLRDNGNGLWPFYALVYLPCTVKQQLTWHNTG